MIVVSNASPLISLSRIGRLNLLLRLYGRILIPADVHHEVTVRGRGYPGSDEVANAPWIEVAQAPSESPSLESACQNLGAGERSAIILAATLRADLLLLDERKARQIAVGSGLAIAGCLAVLEAGFQNGLIADLRQCYVDLLQQGIRFDIRLLQTSLAKHECPEL